MSHPEFFLDTASFKEVDRIWSTFLTGYVGPTSYRGITTNPNSLSKIGCDGLEELDVVISSLCKLVTTMRSGLFGGIVYVQLPNSLMSFNEIFEWAEHISELHDGCTFVGLKIPHWTRVLELTDELSDILEVNVTGVSDWATLCKAFQYPGVTYASLIPGRMEEVGIDADLHMSYINRIRRSHEKQQVIAGSMRTIQGLQSAIIQGTVPTIGTRVWIELMKPRADTGQYDVTQFVDLWDNTDWPELDFVGEMITASDHPPRITDANVQLSVDFFEQMDKLGQTIYKEFIS
ncbi:hypothetical protein LCGC14_2373730 [marine sediment metagenome]|uniref:Transaldolase n=1 Tax=marine sediment metagenome TaxID=412755 RepID=A0A0F9C313_9ZZZZ